MEQNNKMEFSVVILSGGNSRRMGSDKGSLMLKGRSFVEILADRMAGAGEILLSVGERDVYRGEELRHIQDEYKDCGPMGGIHKALKEMNGVWLFVIACDMPDMDYAFAKGLLGWGLRLNPDARVIVPVDEEGRRHMTAAFYHKSLADEIAHLLDTGQLRLQNLAERFETAFVPVSRRADARKLQNVNTPEAYQAFVRRHSIPVLSFVGYSNTGKTTLLGKIVRKLKADGLRVAYLKHSHHEVELSGRQKDNEMIFEAGAGISIVAGRNSMLWLEDREPELEEILAEIRDVDLILVEGYKQAGLEKVLVTASPDRADWAISAEEAILVVGPDDGAAYDFSREDVDGICRWIRRQMDPPVSPRSVISAGDWTPTETDL